MDGFQFISSIVGSVAWPISILLLIYWSRESLHAIISRIIKFKYKDIELDFSHELKVITQQAKRIGIEPTQSSIQETKEKTALQLLDDADSISSVSPEAAVLTAWAPIEKTLYAMLKGVDSLRILNTRDIIDKLATNSALDKDTILLLHEMRQLRNQAAHPGISDRLTTRQAQDFIALARGILQKVAPTPK